ncbi:BamA/TamA family outer membrane protein [Filimonas zeae]|nr:BamA/TamA family outer membrane protein [Filimonas zeae]
MRLLLMAVALLVIILPAFAQLDSAATPPAYKKLLAFPVVARSVETGWMFGGVACALFRIDRKDTVARVSNIEALAMYSLNKQLLTVINGTIYFPNEKYILNHQLSYSYFPDKFWGIGQHAPDSLEEPYQFKQYYVYLHGMRKLKKGLFAGAVYEMQKVMGVEYKSSGLFDKQQVAGRKGYLISGFGGSITYDSRSDAFSPNKGTFLQMIAKYYHPAVGSDYTYTNIIQDVRQYIPVTRKQVLAVQLYNFMNLGDEIPLRSLAALGGSSLMRGYYAGRYRDKQLLALQAEWRVPVYGPFGFVAFGGAGDVARRAMDYDFKDLKLAYGAGIRFALSKKDKLNLRLDYGFTNKKDQGFYLQLGEAF